MENTLRESKLDKKESPTNSNSRRSVSFSPEPPREKVKLTRAALIAQSNSSRHKFAALFAITNIPNNVWQGENQKMKLKFEKVVCTLHDEEILVYYRNTFTNYFGTNIQMNAAIVLTNKRLIELKDSKIAAKVELDSISTITLKQSNCRSSTSSLTVHTKEAEVIHFTFYDSDVAEAIKIILQYVVGHPQVLEPSNAHGVSVDKPEVSGARPDMTFVQFISEEPPGPRVHSFEEFLRSEFSSENIEFFLECRSFRIASGSTPQSLWERHSHTDGKLVPPLPETFRPRLAEICSKFVEDGAPKEINLSARVRHPLIENVRDNNTPLAATVLDEAFFEIVKLMDQDSYHRFQRSRFFPSD